MTFYEEKNMFANSYLDLMEQNYEKIQKYPCDKKPSYLNLSTMTMVCNLTQPIDILSFSDNFLSPKEFNCTIKRPKQNTEFDVTKRGKKKKTFFNQASVHYTTHTTKCIKVFSNGRLHITGVTSMIEAANVCTFTCNLLNNTISLDLSLISYNAIRLISLSQSIGNGVKFNFIRKLKQYFTSGLVLLSSRNLDNANFFSSNVLKNNE